MAKKPQKKMESASIELIKLIENSTSTGVVNFPAGISISAVHNSLLKMIEEDSSNVIPKHFIFNELYLVEARIKLINSWPKLFSIDQITFNKCHVTDDVTTENLEVDKINFNGEDITGSFKIQEIRAVQGATKFIDIIKNSKDVIDFPTNMKVKHLLKAILRLEKSEEIVKFQHIRFNKFKFGDTDVVVVNRIIEKFKISEITLIDCSIYASSYKCMESPKINILSSENTDICTTLAKFIHRILDSEDKNSEIIIGNYNYPHKLFEKFIINPLKIPGNTRSLTLKNITVGDESINSLIQIINNNQFKNLKALTLNGGSFEDYSSIQELVNCSVENKNVNLIFNDPKNQSLNEIIKSLKDLSCLLVERQNLQKNLYEIFNKKADDYSMKNNPCSDSKEQALPKNIISYSTVENMNNESHIAGDLQTTHD